MPLHVSRTMSSSSGGQNCIIQPLVLSHSVGGHGTATYRCDFYLNINQLKCIKLVNIKINMLRCTVNKISKKSIGVMLLESV